MNDQFRIMIVAGEASGDNLGRGLVTALNEAALPRTVEWFGAAGPQMREVGVRPVVEAETMSIVGVAEILGALPMFYRIYRKLIREANELKPDVIVLIDLPDFNLKLAKALKKAGHKVVYYVSPQIWAWRAYRRRTIERYVDLLITILPFEKEWYGKYGIKNVEYVGNPHAAAVAPKRSREEFCRDLGFDDKRPIVAFLPGSRRKEVERILPVMVSSVELIRARETNVQFVVALASESHRALAENMVNRMQVVKIVVGETYDALAAANAAAVKCGTGTLEAGVLGTPMVNVYRTSSLNYTLIKPLVSSKYYSLVNLVADAPVAEEMIQTNLSPALLASELARLLDPEVNRAKRTELAKAMEKLGPGGASMRAAEAMLRLIDN